MMCGLIDTAVQQGARRAPACQTVGLSVRTLERWRGAHPEDARAGPHHAPANQLSSREYRALLRTLNSADYRNVSPHQIVPQLADRGCYLASESTMYRVLRRERMLAHRGRAAAPVRRVKPVHVATGPNQLWSWDITYLPTPVRGVFSYLYLIMDIWSRKIMGAAVYAAQSDRHAAALFRTTCAQHSLHPLGIVLHADNGGPMKGATMQATLERLGVLPSFSRPGVSNDNPYSEALFRTLKYRPGYPSTPFATIAAAGAWVRDFMAWYNGAHRHSAIRFVTPDERHAGRERAILAARHQVYTQARQRHPERWSTTTRNWTPIATVALNPDHAVMYPDHHTAA
jgi:transposase InsO family protein